MENKKIAVLMGGNTGERSISLKGAKEVIKVLNKFGYRVLPVDTGKINGKELAIKLIKKKIDAAFILLHGPIGEDGTIQGFLEILGIPYTGSKVLASSIGMNKEFTKAVLMHHKILTPKYQILYKNEKYKIKLTYPVVVKPTSQGSTLGVSVVPNIADLSSALKIAFKYGNKVLIEEYINGKEITVGVLEENGCVRTLPVIEIVPKAALYDYKSKYMHGESHHIIPPRISKVKQELAGKIALKIYNLLYCRGIARVDMIVTRNEDIYVLEINTIPGLTKTSLIPEAARYDGILFESLIKKIIEPVLKDRNIKTYAKN